MKINGHEAVELTVYQLDAEDCIEPVGRRVLPIVTIVNYEQPDASSKLRKVKIRCVRIGRTLYRIEEEAGRPAIFLPAGAKVPPPTRRK